MRLLESLVDKARAASSREAFIACGRTLLDLVLPTACAGCGREGALFCDACRSSTPTLSGLRCPRCYGALRSAGATCVLCERHPLEHLSSVRAGYAYAGPLRRAILALKYRSLHRVAEPLGELLVECWQRHALGADIIVPIPLHPRRERWRGFNQATLLATRVAQTSELPLMPTGLVRVYDTPPQARALDQAGRQALVAGAFRASQDIAGKTVLLIDDVCTTGATLEAAAAACHEAGAATVWGLVLARTL